MVHEVKKTWRNRGTRKTHLVWPRGILTRKEKGAPKQTAKKKKNRKGYKVRGGGLVVGSQKKIPGLLGKC